MSSNETNMDFENENLDTYSAEKLNEELGVLGFGNLEDLGTFGNDDGKIAIVGNS
jgi:hypothetical protein